MTQAYHFPPRKSMGQRHYMAFIIQLKEREWETGARYFSRSEKKQLSGPCYPIVGRLRSRVSALRGTRKG
jgi:hypothetical protein